MLLTLVFRIVEEQFHCTPAAFHAIRTLKCVPDRRLEGAIPDSIRSDMAEVLPPSHQIVPPAGPRAPAAGLRATRYIGLLDKRRLLEQARGLEQAS